MKRYVMYLKKNMLYKSFSLIFLAMILLLCGCISSEFWSRLNTEISSGKNEVLFRDLTNFDWDTVCIIWPYSLSLHGVEGVIRADLGSFANKVPDVDDDPSWAFAFIKDGIVVDIEKRSWWDYGIVLGFQVQNNCMSPQQAKFIVNYGSSTTLLIPDTVEKEHYDDK